MESDRKNIDQIVTENAWMIRPCVLYAEEYKDCKSIRSRFHQRFVYGTFLDCNQWKTDYDNCLKWTEDNNQKACKDLVESEVLRRIERLKAHNDNDTWEKRTSPPTTWNDPLPEWMEEKLKYSYLKEKSVKVSNETEKSFCVLM
ncbi:synaptic plasticity regulator PANTS [Rhodnius prolixus]|uniref:Synaptic plasticity regulator PANTS n=1 Tax=Rhodnius prolixus TaxID=13249 RepID=T1HTR0_RHOPR